MLFLLLSSAQGPEECARAVALAARQLETEARRYKVSLSLVEQRFGSKPDTFKSVLYRLDGHANQALAERWNGTMQWTCESPFRVSCRRKNWFFTGSLTVLDDCNKGDSPADKDILFEAMRSSGPGGQHANKTNSCIRATHIGSGIDVKVDTERSQHANKRIAKALLQYKLNRLAEQRFACEKRQRRMQHYHIERGGAVRVFKGKRFVETLSCI